MSLNPLLHIKGVSVRLESVGFLLHHPVLCGSCKHHPGVWAGVGWVVEGGGGWGADGAYKPNISRPHRSYDDSPFFMQSSSSGKTRAVRGWWYSGMSRCAWLVPGWSETRLRGPKVSWVAGLQNEIIMLYSFMLPLLSKCTMKILISSSTWNQLPVSVLHATLLSSFKPSLKNLSLFTNLSQSNYPVLINISISTISGSISIDITVATAGMCFMLIFSQLRNEVCSLHEFLVSGWVERLSGSWLASDAARPICKRGEDLCFGQL